MADEPTTFGYTAPPEPEPADYIRRFEKLGFGMFLHYGLFSLMERGEWSQHYHRVPEAEIRALANRFDAKDFNAQEICKVAKNAGMEYLCLTTRHHEGFSLYDTCGLNDFDAPHSLAKRDLIAEFSEACEQNGLKKFFYHTTLDWIHPDFKSDWNAYQQYLRDSVEILCRNYGVVDGFWFDGNWSKPDQDWQEDALYGMMRQHQPECIIINNSSIGALGAKGHPEVDVVTFEQGVPKALHRRGEAKYLAAEMCETINSHWGIAKGDFSHKKPSEIIERLVACRQHRANLLLNLAPEADGSLTTYDQALLEIVGRWTRPLSQVLREGEPTNFQCTGDAFVLRLGVDYYVFIRSLSIHGNGHLSGGHSSNGVMGLEGDLPEVSSVTWCDNDEPLAFSQGQQHLSFVATPFPYGDQRIIRVAKISTKV